MKYTGSCHCGAVSFAAEGMIEQGITCNCSICHKRGSVLAFLPASAVTISGEERSTSYKFNKRVIDHHFCATCGILPYARGAMPDGTPMVALNLRCVDGLDLSTIKTVAYDGASH
ncbi:GFA family protein [Acetobacteraceae bacterium H6797]|nr:GFA family protein [Acetobacteraceae bacterium H6797]